LPSWFWMHLNLQLPSNSLGIGKSYFFENTKESHTSCAESGTYWKQKHSIKQNVHYCICICKNTSLEISGRQPAHLPQATNTSCCKPNHQLNTTFN
jgi:hypothetical protein